MKRTSNIPVIMYHHVTKHGGTLSVSVKNFDKQMRGLAKNGYKTITADELFDFMCGKVHLPKKSVLLTFDDGYLDNWVYAHPVLQNYGLSAVLFAVTGLLGTGSVRNTYDFYDDASLSDDSVPVCPNHQESKAIMFGDNPDSVMLRWSEIKAMRDAGTFETHCHTSTHKRWDLEPNAKKLVEEDDVLRQFASDLNSIDVTVNHKNCNFYNDLSNSKKHLIDNLQGVSNHFCWPQGYFDNEYKSIAKSLGFNALYTTDARGQNIINGDVSHIYRFAIRNKSFAWLNRRLWLAAHPVFGPVYNKWRAAKDARRRARKNTT